MTLAMPRPVVVDDTPCATTVSDAQSTVAIAERDLALLVTAAAMVLNGPDIPAFSTSDRGRLRTVNLVLFKALSTRGQQDVRERVGGDDAATLRRSA